MKRFFKTAILMLAIAAMATSLSSCSEDDIAQPNEMRKAKPKKSIESTKGSQSNLDETMRVLGPRGLMPNPKTGTVTFNSPAVMMNSVMDSSYV